MIVRGQSSSLARTTVILFWIPVKKRLLRSGCMHLMELIGHLAALVHVRNPNLSFTDYSRLNYRASEQLFRRATLAGTSRVIFASTVEVYGSTPQNLLVSEQTPCRPDTDYARTKLLAEESLLTLAANAQLSYAILRFAPVYSASFRLNLDKRLYLGSRKVGYYLGKGNYSLSLCSVHNIVHFVLHWLESEAIESGIFNIADESTYPIRELLDRDGNAGRKVTLRVPYLPCLAAVSAVETVLRLAGRSSGMLSVDNVRKLTRSTVWDVNRAKAAVGELPWNMSNTLKNIEG